MDGLQIQFLADNRGEDAFPLDLETFEAALSPLAAQQVGGHLRSPCGT